MNQILFATHNPGKLNEAQQILGAFQVVSANQYNISDVPETGSTFLENAMIKARHASQFTDLPVFSDDSGLEIDALNGRPGIYSARYSITNDFDANMARVMTELKQVPQALRTARFRIVVVFLRHQDDPKPICIDASWEGSIVMDTYPKTPGFGYDPIFWVPEYQKTASELPKEIKNKLSHRGQALRSLAEQLN